MYTCIDNHVLTLLDKYVYKTYVYLIMYAVVHIHIDMDTRIIDNLYVQAVLYTCILKNVYMIAWYFSHMAVFP